MALDTFTIQLKLELERFIKNISDARLRIKGIEKQAAVTARKVNESFSQIEGPKESVQETEGAISKLGGAFLKVGKVITVAGGIVAGLTLVRFLLADISDGAPRLAAAFGTIGTGVSTLAGSLSGLARVLLGAGSAVTFLTGRLASLSGSIAGVQTGLITLATNPAVRAFASSVVTAMDAVALSVARAAKAIPRFANSLGALTIGGRRIRQIFSTLPAAVGNAAVALGNFASGAAGASGLLLTKLVPSLGGIIKPLRTAVIGLLAFAGILKGAFSAGVAAAFTRISLLVTALETMVVGGAAGIPIIGRLLVGFKKTAVGATLFGAAVGDVGAATTIMSAGIGGVTIAIVALNAAIGITGIILVKLGKALLSTAEKLGILAAKTQLAAKNIEFGLGRANAATEEGVGTLTELGDLIEETSNKFGASVKFVTETTAAFVALQPEMQLSSELFRQVIEDTVVLGVATGQSSRALIDVADVFKNLPGPLRNFAAISTNVTEVQERLAKDSGFLAEVLSKITENTEENILATARAIIVTEGLDARRRTLTEGSDNLIIAQGRLTAAFENLGVTLGATVSPLLSKIVDTLKAFTNILTAIPTPLQAIIGQLVTLAGVAAVLAGTFLKLATAIILVTNAGKILSSILPLQIGRFGSLSQIIQRNTFAFTGNAIAVTGATGIFRSFFAVANEGFRRVTVSLNNFVKALLVFDLSRLTKGLSGFGSGIGGVGLRATLATVGMKIFRSALVRLLIVLGPIILAIEFVSRLFSRLNARFKATEAITRLLNRVFGINLDISEALGFVLAKLSQILELAVLAAMGVVELAALALIQSFVALLDAIEFLNKGFDFLTFGIFRTEEGFKELTKGIREVAEAGRDELGVALKENIEDMFELTKRIASAKVGFEDLEDAEEKAGGAGKKIIVTVKQLAAGFDILRTSLDAAFKNTEEQFDTRLENIKRMRDAQIELVDATIQSEDLKAKAVLQIERRTSREIIALSERRLNKALDDINKREQAELKAIEIATDAESQSFEERIKALAEVTQAANEARLERLREFEKVTDAEIDAEQAAARKRKKIVEDTEKEIENFQKAADRRREDRRISLLTGERRARAEQERFDKSISKSREAREEGRFDESSKFLDQAQKDASTLVGQAGKTAQAQTLANQGGATKDRGIARARLDDIRKLFFGRIPAIAQKSFSEVSSALFRGLDPTKAFQRLERELEQLARKQKADAANRADDRVQAERKVTAAAQKEAADAEDKEAVKRIKDIRKQNIDAAREIEKLKEKIAKPFEVVAEFFAKPEDVERIFAIRDKIKEAIEVPVIFGADKAKLDIGEITEGQEQILDLAKRIREEDIRPTQEQITAAGPGGLGAARVTAAAQKFGVPLGGLDPSLTEGQRRRISGTGFEGLGKEKAEEEARRLLTAVELAFSGSDLEIPVKFRKPDAKDLALLAAVPPVEIEVKPKVDQADVFNVFGEAVDVKVQPDPLSTEQAETKLEQTLTPEVTLKLKAEEGGTMRVVREIVGQAGTIEIPISVGIKPEDAQAALAKAKQQFQEGVKVDLQPSISPESQARVDQIKANLAQPVNDPVLFQIDQASAGAVRQLRAEFSKPVFMKVIVQKQGEVQDGSPHNLGDIADVLRNLLTPEPIMANVRADASDAMRAAAGGGGAGAAPRTVRVDINMEGESTPINVASDADAERLTTFANRLKNIGRTKGNFRSPFVRNS